MLCVCVCNYRPCPWSRLITVAAGRPCFQHTAGPIPPPEDRNTKLSAHPPRPHQLLELEKADKLLQMQQPSSSKSLFEHGQAGASIRWAGPVIPKPVILILAAADSPSLSGPRVLVQESRYHRR